MDENDHNWRDFFDDRQNMEMLFAQEYAERFMHGTDGHNRIALINRLRLLIDDIWDQVLSEQQKEVIWRAIVEAQQGNTQSN